MPTRHGLGFGNGRLVEYEDGTVAYYKTGELTQTFRVPIAEVQSFSVAKRGTPWKRTLSLIGCGTVLASASLPLGAVQKIEEWFRHHPRFANHAPTWLTAEPPFGTAGLLIADELRKLASLREEEILTDEEFAARKQLLLGRST